MEWGFPCIQNQSLVLLLSVGARSTRKCCLFSFSTRAQHLRDYVTGSGRKYSARRPDGSIVWSIVSSFPLIVTNTHTHLMINGRKLQVELAQKGSSCKWGPRSTVMSAHRWPGSISGSSAPRCAGLWLFYCHNRAVQLRVINVQTTCSRLDGLVKKNYTALFLYAHCTEKT